MKAGTASKRELAIVEHRDQKERHQPDADKLHLAAASSRPGRASCAVAL
jgi:hypothetical protein